MTASWTTPPAFTPYSIGENDWFQLVADWTVKIGKYTLKVPCGFVSDGPSIPWLVQPITPVNGHNRIPALVHDALYAISGGGLITRAQTDKLFFDLLGSSFRSRLMWLGVRVGGGGAWKDESDADKLNDALGTLPTISCA